MSHASELTAGNPPIPSATLALVATALVLAAIPGAGVALEYDASRVNAEPWRLASSQLVHWSVRMLLGDLLLLGIAGWILERRSPRLARLAILIGFGATATTLAVATGLARYRGSSGIGTTLIVAGALELGVRAREPRARLTAALVLAFVALKVFLEATGTARGAMTNLPEGVLPATAVHAFGAVAGVVAWAWSSIRRRPTTP